MGRIQLGFGLRQNVVNDKIALVRVSGEPGKSHGFTVIFVIGPREGSRDPRFHDSVGVRPALVASNKKVSGVRERVENPNQTIFSSIKFPWNAVSAHLVWLENGTYLIVFGLRDG